MDMCGECMWIGGDIEDLIWMVRVWEWIGGLIEC